MERVTRARYADRGRGDFKAAAKRGRPEIHVGFVEIGGL